jgi:hypothetical protein
METIHYLTRMLERVSTEMSLYVLVYNLKRVMRIIGYRSDDAGNERLRPSSFSALLHIKHVHQSNDRISNTGTCF